ncbi:MAG: NnrU family protein [Geminicoccaceae bacterium]
MLNLAIAALFLLGTHFGIASTLLRGQLIARVGEGFYRMLYSLLALSAFAWLVLAWRAAPFDPLWSTGVGLHHLVAALMPLPLLLAVCAVTAPNPTVVGQRPDPDASAPAAGIIRVTRHPLMWAIGIWALLHLAVNGDLASLLFFGALATLALAGTILIDQRRTRQNAPGWGVFLQATSNLPFAAILERRQRLAPGEIGLWRVALALALYVAVLWLHPVLFGVAPLG